MIELKRAYQTIDACI